jgi:hypothetical protein
MEIIDKIKHTRQQEIEEGKNAATVPPIYVVLERIFSVCEITSDYSQGTTVFDDDEEYVRVNSDGDEMPAEQSRDKWREVIAVDEVLYYPVVKKSFHDRFVTVAFTRKAAEDYIEMDRHNLTNPRIYVFGVNRRNIELLELIKLLGDKSF